MEFSKYNNYFNLSIRDGYKQFLSLFACAYGEQASDRLLHSTMDCSVTDIGEFLSFGRDKVQALCCSLVENCYISPILHFAVDLKTCDICNKSNFYDKFLTILKGVKKKVALDTERDIATICENCISMLLEKYRESGEEEDLALAFCSLDTSIFSVEKYICDEIIGLKDRKDSINIINSFVENITSKSTLAKAALLLPVCQINDLQIIAFAFTKFVFPAFKETVFDSSSLNNNAIFKHLARLWFSEAENFCNNAMTVNTNALKLYDANSDDNFKPFVLDDAISYIINNKLSFSDVFTTPCKNFGSAIYDFMESGEAESVNIGDDNANSNALDKSSLINYIRKSVPTAIGNLLLLAPLFLFADGEEKKGVHALIKAFSAYGLRNGIKHTKNIRIALLMAFFNSTDFDEKSALYNTIKNEQNRLTRRYYGSEKENIRPFSNYIMSKIEIDYYNFQLDIMLQKCEELAKLTIDDLSFESEKAKEVKSELMDLFVCFFAENCVDFDNLLKEKAADFLKIVDPSKTDIYASLSDKAKRQVQDYLIESELFFEFISRARKSKKLSDSLEYTASTITVSKALEYLGNLIYRKAVENATPRGNDFRHFLWDNDWKNSVEIGKIAYMFDILKFRNGGSQTPNIQDTDDKIYPKLYDVISTEKIKNLKGSFNIKDKSGNSQTLTFTDDLDNNMAVFYQALIYISDFRNNAAHKDMLPEEAYFTCKELLLTSHYVFWALLYIIQDDLQLEE